MKNRFHITSAVLLILSLTFFWGCEEEQPSFPNQYNTGLAKTQGTIEQVTINSLYVGEAKTANIYLPAGYDPTADKTYPVVYMLHGIFSDEDYWLQTYYLKELADQLIADGKIQPMIMVMPNARNAMGGSFYTNSVDIDPNRNPMMNPALGFGLYEYYLIQEVIPTVEAQYKIDPDRRAIQGKSMGGYGAIKLALLYPTMFKSIAAHSGPLAFDALIFSEGSNLLPRLAMEQVDSLGNPLPIIDLAAAVADPAHHVLTLMSFGLASAFSPHFGPAGTYDSYLLSIGYPGINSSKVYQYMVSSTPIDTAGPGPVDDIYPGVDLPFRIAQPGVTADTVTESYTKFLMHDCYTMLATGKAPDQTDLDIDSFKKLNLYIDCGIQDDTNPGDDGMGLNIIPTNDAFHELLNQMGIEHRYERYTGDHMSDVYYRVEIGLKEHDKVFK